MNGQIGTIVELNPIDALGWIDLDQGGRVRFGGTSLKGFVTQPGVGTRVEVRGTKPGFKGVPKAVEVVPLVAPETARSSPDGARSHGEPGGAKMPWPLFVREYPRWSDVADTYVHCACPAPRPALPPHPLFAPWHREIGETAPTYVGLVVPTYWQPDPFDPGPGDCFAHGRIAFLDEPRWPSCGACARPLEMCVQLSPAVLADFLLGGRGLVALFCFHCGYANRDPHVAHVRLVEPRHRVVGPEAWASASSGWLPATQRVRPRPPRAMPPSSIWHRDRSAVTKGTASSALLGFDAVPVTGPFPPGVDPACLDDLRATYDDWLEELPRGDGWGGACLGGVASWDQGDDTPSCAHGEMLHLLDYEGGQFLDGGLHVFTCRERACELAFVAEF